MVEIVSETEKSSSVCKSQNCQFSTLKIKEGMVNSTQSKHCTGAPG